MTLSRVTLYALRNGAVYHTDPRCLGLNSWYMANDDPLGYVEPPRVKMSEIRRRTLRPCRSCQPPPVLALVPPR